MQVVSPEFTYRTIQEILDLVPTYFTTNFFATLTFVICLWISLTLILYILPVYYIIRAGKKTDKIKLTKKLALKQMTLQKEIETEIEKELEAQKEMAIKQKIS